MIVLIFSFILSFFSAQKEKIDFYKLKRNDSLSVAINDSSIVVKFCSSGSWKSYCKINYASEKLATSELKVLNDSLYILSYKIFQNEGFTNEEFILLKYENNKPLISLYGALSSINVKNTNSLETYFWEKRTNISPINDTMLNVISSRIVYDYENNNLKIDSTVFEFQLKYDSKRKIFFFDEELLNGEYEVLSKEYFDRKTKSIEYKNIEINSLFNEKAFSTFFIDSNVKYCFIKGNWYLLRRNLSNSLEQRIEIFYLN